MKKLIAILILAGITLVLTGCGSSSGATPVGAGQGNFSNGSLNGQYTYQIAGYDLSSGAAYREAGYFVANGSGTLTSGSDDFEEPSTGGVQTTATTGTYAIANDGTGTLALTLPTGTLNFSLTLVSSNEVLLNEADSGAIAAGHAALQTASALASVPSGTFAFRLHSCITCSGSDSAALVGGMTVASGVVSGQDDVLRSGIFDNNTGGALAITGTLNPPSTSGRGTGSITDATGTVNFIYYIVNANDLRFLVSDSGVIGLGRAQTQSGPFSNSSLNGNYAFGSRADDATDGLNAQDSAGMFTAGGNGTISAGSLDSVQDGSSVAQGVGLTGSYAATSNGRATVTITPTGLAAIQQVYWMVSPTSAYFLTNSSAKVEDGTAMQQQGSFSNGSLNAQYAFSMNGLEFTSSGTIALTRVGWIIWNGSGALTWNESTNNSQSGFSQPGELSGSYSVAGSGRVAATVNNLSINSNDMVIYLVSANSGYMLQNDAGVEIVGPMAVQ